MSAGESTRKALVVGDRVRVVAAIDQEIHDVSAYVGKCGRIVKIIHEHPRLGVEFRPHRGKRATEYFWGEEVERA